jgi:hypothetical protein
VDHGERDNRALALELVLVNFPGPAAIGAEGPWREEVPAGRFDRDKKDVREEFYLDFCISRISFPICFTVLFLRLFLRSLV